MIWTATEDGKFEVSSDNPIELAGIFPERYQELAMMRPNLITALEFFIDPECYQQYIRLRDCIGSPWED